MNERLSILCLDDEHRILNSLRAVFRLKYNVFIADNAAEAINILKDNEIAAVISDQRMPEMTGVEFLAIAKEVSPDTTRILLTGFSDLDAIISSVNSSEVYRFLTKPWSNQRILEIVAESVELYLTVKNVEQEEPLEDPFSGLEQAVARISKTTSDEDEEESLPKESGSVLDRRLNIVAKDRSYLIYKTPSTTAFEEVNSRVSENVVLLHATNNKEVIQLLENYPVKILISFLAENSDDDVEFLKFLKRELPELLSIGIVEFADYEEIITLINEAKLYRYLIMPVRINQLIFFVNSAIRQYDIYNRYPQLLKQQKVFEDKPIKESIVSLVGSFFSKMRLKRS